MMPLRLLLSLLSLLITSLSFSQIIEGEVYEIGSRKQLSNAHISIPSLSKVVFSDKNAFFTINPGKGGIYALKASFVGFADTVFNVSVAENDTIHISIGLRPLIVMLDSVFVTAGRYGQKNTEIPSRVAVIEAEAFETFAFNNTDELLLMVPGIHTDRDFGIFARNAGVTMRGLNSTARVLVLLNGSPLNKADGGGINWNRISPGQIERIEIVKGPASTIYGGNAMGGIINIITSKTDDKLAISVNAGAGSYSSEFLNTIISGNEIKNEKGFYWSLNNFLRRGDGYLVNPDEQTAKYDTTVFVKEIGVNGLLGYQINKSSDIEMEYNFWDDIRSDGVKVFEKLGSYSQFKTHAGRLTLNHKAGKAILKVQTYYQLENYFRQNESVGKKNNKYRYYDTYSDREDYGVLTSCSFPVGESLFLTGGIDAKQGSVNNSEVYYTSTDRTFKTGQLNQYSLYALANGHMLKKKLNFSLGVRYDYIKFLNGSFKIETPSSLTAFINNYPVVFTDETWGAISPKASVKYRFNNKFSGYLAYAIGYRAPMLDDMCTNRSITKGFKIANTQLGPEYLHNYEAGFDYKISKNIHLETSFYYSVGKGFHYFVGTGDSVDTGGEELKPVLIRDNIAGVVIKGIEQALFVNFNKKLKLTANYAHNYSVISDFKNENYENKDLEGKFLMEVPANTFNTSVIFSSKYLNSGLSFHFVDKQWGDDENTYQNPSYHYFNLKLSSPVLKFCKLGLSVINILDNKYLNNKGQLSPGRFVMFDVSYNFSRKN